MNRIRYYKTKFNFQNYLQNILQIDLFIRGEIQSEKFIDFNKIEFRTLKEANQNYEKFYPQFKHLIIMKPKNIFLFTSTLAFILQLLSKFLKNDLIFGISLIVFAFSLFYILKIMKEIFPKKFKKTKK